MQQCQDHHFIASGTLADKDTFRSPLIRALSLTRLESVFCSEGLGRHNLCCTARRHSIQAISPTPSRTGSNGSSHADLRMPDSSGTHCAAFSVRSSIFCVPAVPGAICPPTSHRGRRCTITFGSFVARASGPISGASCEQLNVAGWARMPIPVPPSWAARA